jgi:hypothetical protein
VTTRFTKEAAVRRLFRDHDYVIHDIRHSSHWQVWASRGGGSVQHFTIPTTPSDYRGVRNMIKNLERGYVNRRTG